MILSWLLNAIYREIASSVLYHELAKDFWDDLAVQFQQSNEPCLYQLKKDISNLMLENLTVTTYFTRLKGLWDELSNYIATKKCVCCQGSACGKSSHEDYVLQFLMGLNGTYSQIRGQILLSDPPPSISKVYALIVQEEPQRTAVGHVPSIESATMLSKNYSSNAHKKRYQKNNKQKRPCSHCGYENHTIEKCYKQHSYPPRYKFTKNKPTSRYTSYAHQVIADKDLINAANYCPFTPEQCEQVLSLLKAFNSSSLSSSFAINNNSTYYMSGRSLPSVFSAFQSNKTNPWIIDMGATDHIIHSTSMFHTYSRITSKVQLLNGQKVESTHIGTVKLSNDLCLTNVLYVLAFNFNLLSVSKLTSDSHLWLYFASSHSNIQDLVSKKIIGAALSSNSKSNNSNRLFRFCRLHHLLSNICRSHEIFKGLQTFQILSSVSADLDSSIIFLASVCSSTIG
ncbi:uncharacterized protein LOC131150428 [Malania oleifera]|uniref:uncharacterized protein LOC131150428 n=1 Tax=Malania oleifera TaxID=397392 RepID=UPI0025AE0A44|nr:uncharacterized protein LOC131150428 [Malania oleifera]